MQSLSPLNMESFLQAVEVRDIQSVRAVQSEEVLPGWNGGHGVTLWKLSGDPANSQQENGGLEFHSQQKLKSSNSVSGLGSEFFPEPPEKIPNQLPPWLGSYEILRWGHSWTLLDLWPVNAVTVNLEFVIICYTAIQTNSKNFIEIMQIIEINSVSHFNEMYTFQFRELESWEFSSTLVALSEVIYKHKRWMPIYTRRFTVTCRTDWFSRWVCTF